MVAGVLDLDLSALSSTRVKCMSCAFKSGNCKSCHMPDSFVARFTLSPRERTTLKKEHCISHDRTPGKQHDGVLGISHSDRCCWSMHWLNWTKISRQWLTLHCQTTIRLQHRQNLLLWLREMEQHQSKACLKHSNEKEQKENKKNNRNQWVTNEGQQQTRFQHWWYDSVPSGNTNFDQQG